MIFLNTASAFTVQVRLEYIRGRDAVDAVFALFAANVCNVHQIMRRNGSETLVPEQNRDIRKFFEKFFEYLGLFASRPDASVHVFWIAEDYLGDVIFFSDIYGMLRYFMKSFFVKLGQGGNAEAQLVRDGVAGTRIAEVYS